MQSMNINMGRIAFYFKAGNKYKIHSPLLYSFTNEVIEDRDCYYADIDLKKLHEFIVSNHPSWKKNLLPLKNYLSLFRISKWFQPQQIIIMGDQDGGLSALALHYGARNAILNIQSESLEMEEWIRKHFKLFNIPEPPLLFLKDDSIFKSQAFQKTLYLLDASRMDWSELNTIYDQQSEPQPETCVIISNLCYSNFIRRSWMEITKSGKKGCFYIDLYDIGVIIYTGNEQESVYQAIVSYLKKWFQVY